MDFLNIISNNFKFHFIGIGGISMSGLAKYLISLGKTVSGSDIGRSIVTDELCDLGVQIFIGHSAENIDDVDVVIYTSAISEDNPEILAAKDKGILLLKRSQLLGMISKLFSRTVGVAGSHGKTTTTAMISHILSHADYEPTCFIGGADRSYGNFVKGKGEYCVYEACEYKSNFLNMKPYLSVVLNIDLDHLDSYGSENDIIEAFNKFVSQGLSLVNVDDKLSSKIITSTSVTFGIESKADYMATNLTSKNGIYSFTVSSSRVLGRISLNVAGKHNVYNALAAVAVADILGIRFYHIKRALKAFEGVARRLENIGKVFGATAYADYAHHPKEITETLKVFCDPIVVFQPHTYSRTQYLMNDFVKCLSDCKRLIIYKTYPARERFMIQGSARTLYNNIKKEKTICCEYADSIETLKETLSSIVECGDTVIFFGAGDIYDISLKMLDK